MSDSNNDLQFSTQDLNELAYSISQDFGLSDIADIQVSEESGNNDKVTLLSQDDDHGEEIEMMHQDDHSHIGNNSIDLEMDTIVIETINNDMDMNDAVVFDNVANEVSISSTSSLDKPGHFLNQHPGTHQTLSHSQPQVVRLPKPAKPAKIRAPPRQTRPTPVGTSQPHIISSLNLSQLGTPQLFTALPRMTQQQQPKTKVVKKSPSTGTVLQQVDPGSTLKVIYTSQGQQIVFSPAKTPQTSTTSAVVNLTNSNVTSFNRVVSLANGTPTGKVINITGQNASPGKVMIKPVDSKQQPVTTTTIGTSAGHPQQVIILSSPMKASGATPVQTVQTSGKLMSSSKSPQRPLAPAPPQPKIAISKSASGDVKPVQLIRVVPVSSSQPMGSSANSIVSGTKFVPLRPIAPNTKTISAGVSATPMQKVLVPASALKALGTPISVTSSGGTAMPTQGTILAATGPGGTGQVFMLPNAPLLKIASPSGTVQAISQAVSANKSVTFATGTPLTTQRTSFVPIAPSPMTSATATTSLSASHLNSVKLTNGIKQEEAHQRKPCNCTKSQCLKLYCDCFANGEFCSCCNCVSCHNNLDHEEERQKAIRQCLERNPQAFHPKIGKGRAGDLERRHTKGCNCRRSGCLKNYCECYEAKILCSGLCKCVGCKNFEESFERKTLMHLADAAEVRSAQQTVATKNRLWGNDFRPKLPIKVDNDRLACNFITQEVIDATCQCLLAQAEYGEKNKLDYKAIEALVLEEFGRCLTQIIDCANKTKNSKTIKHELY